MKEQYNKSHGLCKLFFFVLDSFRNCWLYSCSGTKGVHLNPYIGQTFNWIQIGYVHICFISTNIAFIWTLYSLCKIREFKWNSFWLELDYILVLYMLTFKRYRQRYWFTCMEVSNKLEYLFMHFCSKRLDFRVKQVF